MRLGLILGAGIDLDKIKSNSPNVVRKALFGSAIRR